MKRAQLDLTIDDDDECVQTTTKRSKASRFESIEALARAVGLSVFMLGVLCDQYEPKSGKFIAPPVLISAIFPNNQVRSFCDSELKRLRDVANTTADKRLSNDDVIKSVLLARERALKKQKVVLCGAESQTEQLPAREIDRRLAWEFCGVAQTAWGYSIFVYYTGPTTPAIDGSRPEHWRPVHRTQLACFHRRVRKIEHYVAHTQNEQRQGAGSESLPASYDPRFIVNKWRKTAERHIETIVANIDLFRRDDFLVSLVKRPAVVEEKEEGGGPPPFDVEADRLAQKARGYVVTNNKQLCTVTMRDYPELCRSPLCNDVQFSLDELVYLAKRLEGRHQWDPAVLMRAIVIGLNHESHIKRATARVCDRHGLILERNNVVPIVEFLLSNEEARRELQDAAAEYVRALLACDLVSRDVPLPIFDKLLVPSDKDFVLL